MKTDLKSLNIFTNLLILFQHIFALIYSFGILYSIGASWLLWLIWICLQAVAFASFFFSRVAAIAANDLADNEVTESN